MSEREDRHGGDSSPELDSQPPQFWNPKSTIEVEGIVGLYIIPLKSSYLDKTINGAPFLFKGAVGIQYFS